MFKKLGESEAIKAVPKCWGFLLMILVPKNSRANWVIGALLVVFLAVFTLNNAEGAPVACRPVTDLMDFIEEKETDPVSFDFLDIDERERFASKTGLRGFEAVQIMVARKNIETDVLVAIIRDGCITDVRFFPLEMLEIIKGDAA